MPTADDAMLPSRTLFFWLLAFCLLPVAVAPAATAPAREPPALDSVAQGLALEERQAAPGGPGCEDPAALGLLQRHKRPEATPQPQPPPQPPRGQAASHAGPVPAGQVRVGLSKQESSANHSYAFPTRSRRLAALPSQPLGPRVEDIRAPSLTWAITALALITLVAASIVICCSTESAIKPPKCCRELWAVALLGGSLLAIGAVLLAVWYLSGALVKEAVEQFDTAFIGTEVSVDDLQFNPFTGVLKATGIVISNPPGWESEHLLKASSLSLVLGMAPLVLSLGGRINVDDVMVEHINVIYERSAQSSNVDDIMHRLGLGRGGGGGGDGDGGHARSVSVGEVNVTDISAKAAARILMGMGITVSVPDVRFHDFTREMGDCTVSDIVRILLRIVLDAAAKATGRPAVNISRPSLLQRAQ